MDIQATQTNSVQQFSALNAFRTNKDIKKPEQEKQEETLSGTNTTSSKSLLEKINLDEIRECAKSVGEFNITDDEIKYGLMYGRSVIAEWLC